MKWKPNKIITILLLSVFMLTTIIPINTFADELDVSVEEQKQSDTEGSEVVQDPADPADPPAADEPGEDPLDPADPADPVDPADPPPAADDPGEDPQDPADPADPADPPAADEPGEDPQDPTDPVDPADPPAADEPEEDPLDPADPADPADPPTADKPQEDPLDPADPTDPSAPLNPGLVVDENGLYAGLDDLLGLDMILASTFTVTYDANGGSGTVPTDASSYSVDDEAIIQGNTGSLSKDGKRFDGWSLNTPGSYPIYRVGDVLTMPDSNVTLYANWQPYMDYQVTNGPYPLSVKSSNSKTVAQYMWTFEGDLYIAILGTEGKPFINVSLNGEQFLTDKEENDSANIQSVLQMDKANQITDPITIDNIPYKIPEELPDFNINTNHARWYVLNLGEKDISLSAPITLGLSTGSGGFNAWGDKALVIEIDAPLNVYHQYGADATPIWDEAQSGMLEGNLSYNVHSLDPDDYELDSFDVKIDGDAINDGNANYPVINEDGSIKKLSGSIPSTATNISITFIYKAITADSGSLTINKLLQSSDGTVIDDARAFDILITGPNEYANTTTISNGIPLVLNDLEFGTYTVTELNNDYYDVTISGPVDIVATTPTGTIDITNKEKKLGQVKFRKIVTNEETDRQFSLWLKDLDNNQATWAIWVKEDTAAPDITDNSVTVGGMLPGRYEIKEVVPMNYGLDNIAVDRETLAIDDQGKYIVEITQGDIEIGNVPEVTITNRRNNISYFYNDALAVNTFNILVEEPLIIEAIEAILPDDN